MNRRNLLKTMLAAPAVIRSGVLMPIVPLVAAPALQPWQQLLVDVWIRRAGDGVVQTGADGGHLVPQQFAQRIIMQLDDSKIILAVQPHSHYARFQS